MHNAEGKNYEVGIREARVSKRLQLEIAMLFKKEKTFTGQVSETLKSLVVQLESSERTGKSRNAF